MGLITLRERIILDVLQTEDFDLLKKIATQLKLHKSVISTEEVLPEQGSAAYALEMAGSISEEAGLEVEQIITDEFSSIEGEW